MALVRKREEWSPMREIMQFREEIDRLFEDFFSPWPVRRRRRQEVTWLPDVDVYEDENNVIVEADLPGLKGDEVDISITGNTLTIKGEKKQEKEEKGRNYYIVERSYGSFARSIELPAEVEPDKAKATMRNGVLKVTIPKAPEAKPKQIKVEVK